jgi:GNAT superfamily N-acetyltransferase
MSSVLNLRVELSRRPEVAGVPGVAIRHYAGPADIPVWLELRARAFAREKVGVGRWEVTDFEREFLQKAWWSPERMWLAQATDRLGIPCPVGTVAWADRGREGEIRPAVHWLAVLPSCRRRGVGRLLLETLHAACWDAGYREVWLETHAGWQKAASLYESLGYRPVG